jgi:uncharacterized protein (TIGR02001 family)
VSGRCWTARRTRFRLPAAASLTVGLLATAGGAYAQDPTETFVEPAAPTSALVFSGNTTLTTDYVFRGFSQTDQGPAIQGGIEAEYKIFYLGVWGSNVDFGSDVNRAGNLETVANLEIDWYGGVRPEWKGISFDFGVFYYTFPGSLQSWKLDYVEFGSAASYTFFDKLTVGVANWWTPENSGHVGYNDVLEGSASYAFDTISIFSPSVSALVGRQWGEKSAGGYDYTYWNAGLTLDFNEQPAFSLDVRYWDTNIAGCAVATIFQCDERVVGSLTAIF